MKRRKRRKRINYYGHLYFEGDAVSALQPRPADYGMRPTETESLSIEIQKWRAARSRFVWTRTILDTVAVIAGASFIWDYHEVLEWALGLVWFPTFLLSSCLSERYGDHPGAAKLAAFNRASREWSRTAPPFIAHRRTIRPWIRMSGFDFEKAVARLLRIRGIDARPTKASGDGGVDIEVFTNGRLHMVIQCRRYRSACGPSVVRELYGAMHHHRAPQAMLICLGGFSSAARDFASGKPIELVDSKMLIEFRNGHADNLFWGLLKEATVKPSERLNQMPK